MKNLILPLIFILSGFTSVFAQEDLEGSKDPSWFTRMPDHYISYYIDKEFEKVDFQIGEDKFQSVEGHYYQLNYALQEGKQPVGGLQVIRNYENAVKKIGGKVVWEWYDSGSGRATLKIEKGGAEVWAEVSCNGSGYYRLDIVEKGQMDQDVVADASSMANTIKTTGKVALYGIYFDTGKSELKPESQNALEEISKLLKADPSLKLYVVGHTDNVGTYESNIKLSMDRAAAVINALVTKHSVNAASLKPFGNGPCSPVATNDTEAGKALNRRVELVKQ
jgi:outer membrane protein OmpA-like peptidoglycan-associated protein